MFPLPNFLETLQAVPFIDRLEFFEPTDQSPELIVYTPDGPRTLQLSIHRSHLSYRSIAERSHAAESRPGAPLLLLAPYVGPGMAQHLKDAGINFLDEVGNHYLNLGDTYITSAEGRRPVVPPLRDRGIRDAGYRTLFALMARPALAAATVRELADAAGVGKSTAANLRQRLEEEGAILKRGGERELVCSEALMRRWLAGYQDVVRPHLLIGRYDVGDTASKLALTAATERLQERLAASEIPWAWGGGTAALALTGTYRGIGITLHMSADHKKTMQLLRVRPSPAGALLVLDIPGPIALEGHRPHTVHPLLVYSELCMVDDERSHDVAAELRERFLGDFS